MPTTEKYKQVAAEKEELELIESLPTGGSVGWFGPRKAKNVFGYIPGGGLCINASVYQVSMAYEVFTMAKELNGDTALAVLSYGDYLPQKYLYSTHYKTLTTWYLTRCLHESPVSCPGRPDSPVR